ncbi:MAG TPA: thrombospondin type 3 repeat-containing protein, partial [Acidobacteriota bacterium]|nr:thrombospondin type 3 repeat-containing protein [Acidobacteriota bacterium]
MNRTSCRNSWPLGFFVLVCGSLLFTFIGNVHPQNFPQGSQAVGRTEPKIIVPFVVTDAGPFMFYTDTDHDGMSDACETASGLDPNNPVDADGDLDGDGLTNGDECA